MLTSAIFALREVSLRSINFIVRMAGSIITVMRAMIVLLLPEREVNP